jgi:hypothetical protein
LGIWRWELEWGAGVNLGMCRWELGWGEMSVDVGFGLRVGRAWVGALVCVPVGAGVGRAGGDYCRPELLLLSAGAEARVEAGVGVAPQRVP